MAKIEAVILDWAGTAVDFGSQAPVQAFVESFRQFGITPTPEEVRTPMGMLKWDHIHTMMQMPRIRQAWQEVHGSPWTLGDVEAVYRTSERAILKILKDYATPKPYVLEAVQRLRQRGIKIGSTTGYTDEMMAIVAPAAQAQGYAPDAMFTPDTVRGKGRPWPYMVFRNLEALGVSSTAAALKIGDTAADIAEGKAAGLLSVGVVEGSSIMGLSQEEYEALSPEEQDACKAKVHHRYEELGADFILENMSELDDLIFDLEHR
ncbi:MAG: phosphonoacetaldehyde hydrolase [Clostridiales bacterium]|nr:phosphonoacetaldehyde hydrolase [Clostridiales bacterium]